MTHVTCRLTAKNWDQPRSLRSVIEYRLYLFYHSFMQRSPLFIPLVLNFSAVCIVFEALNVMCTFVATKPSRRLGYDVHSAGTLAAC